MYLFSYDIPYLFMYLNTLYGFPPLHPRLVLSQSNISYTDNLFRFFKLNILSILYIAANA